MSSLYIAIFDANDGRAVAGYDTLEEAREAHRSIRYGDDLWHQLDEIGATVFDMYVQHPSIGQEHSIVEVDLEACPLR